MVDSDAKRWFGWNFVEMARSRMAVCVSNQVTSDNARRSYLISPDHVAGRPRSSASESMGQLQSEVLEKGKLAKKSCQKSGVYREGGESFATDECGCCGCCAPTMKSGPLVLLANCIKLLPSIFQMEIPNQCQSSLKKIAQRNRRQF